MLDLSQIASSNASRDGMRRDVQDLLDRADRLAARGHDAAAKPLLAAAMAANTLLDGRGLDRSPATVLARAVQCLHEANGNPHLAERNATAHGDELAAAYLRAAANPHDTTSAAVLAPTIIGPVIQALAPLSVYLRHVVPVELPPGVNAVHMPRLDTAPTPAWVGESGAVPVVAGAAGAGVTLTVKKIGAIVVATNELFTRSAFAALLQGAILRKIAAAVDARFFASTTATNAPDGIFASGSGTSVSASATATAEGAVEDFANLIKTAEAAGVSLASASFVINPTTRAKLNAAKSTGGHMPFVGVESFAGIPIESSAGVPVGRVGLVEWAEVQGVTQGLPEIALSTAGTLHMDDAPADADILTKTQDGRSLFQTDSAAVRVLFPQGWASLHAVGACYVDAVAWD